MLIDKISQTWGKPSYVPLKVEGTILVVGTGENVVSVDLDVMQSDTSTTVYIMQNYDGTLAVGIDNGITPVLTADIPPAKNELVATGKTNGSGEETYQPETKEVDVDNIYFTLYPLRYPLTAENE